MLLIPAIDLKNGKCVRLVQGRMEDETVYSDNPVAVAQGWEAKGANMLHLVDLDGAFAGAPKNLEVIQGILKTVKIPVQLGGGIRDIETIEKLLDLGINRVILGTIAIKNPQLVAEACKRFGGEKIVVGIDGKDGKVAIHGWAETSEKTTVELGLEMKAMGVVRTVYTDISRDGMLTGPNVPSSKEMAEKTGLKVVASGGMSSLQDIRDLLAVEEFGVDSIILGKALYTGAIQLEEALVLTEKEGK